MSTLEDLSKTIKTFLEKRSGRVVFSGKFDNEDIVVCWLTTNIVADNQDLECVIRGPNMENYEFHYAGDFDFEKLRDPLFSVLFAFRNKFRNRPGYQLLCEYQE